MKTSIKLFALVLSFFSYQFLIAQDWEEQAIGILPLNYGVFDISIVDENIVWAIAFDVNLGFEIPSNHIIKVLKTLDGGSTWESFDVEEAKGRISFDIEALDSSIAFITTINKNIDGSGRGVFKTEDGGDTWVEKFYGQAGAVWIKFFNEQEGVVINRQAMATTQDGGESWQRVSSDNIPSFQSKEATLISSGNNSCEVIGNHVWFGTNQGRIYRSKDKGNTWEVFNTSLGNNAIILSVAFQDTLSGIALDAGFAPRTLFAESNNGGESWNNISSNPRIVIANMEHVTGSQIIGTSDIYTPAIDQVSAYSSDFGKNWEIINTNIPFGGTEFISPNIGWTSRGIITSSNQAAMYKWQSDIFVSSREVEQQTKIDLYPNPTADYIFVGSPKVVKEYRLSTVNGQIIQSNTLNLKETSINFQHLKLGMYILELIFDDNSSVSKKIFKVN